MDDAEALFWDCAVELYDIDGVTESVERALAEKNQAFVGRVVEGGGFGGDHAHAPAPRW